MCGQASGAPRTADMLPRMDLFQTQFIVSIVIVIASSLIGLLILWFVIYTAVRSALRSDRERAQRDQIGLRNRSHPAS